MPMDILKLVNELSAEALAEMRELIAFDSLTNDDQMDCKSAVESALEKMATRIQEEMKERLKFLDIY